MKTVYVNVSQIQLTRPCVISCSLVHSIVIGRRITTPRILRFYSKSYNHRKFLPSITFIVFDKKIHLSYAVSKKLQEKYKQVVHNFNSVSVYTETFNLKDVCFIYPFVYLFLYYQGPQGLFNRLKNN